MRSEITTVQVYCGGPEGYSNAFTSTINSGQWQRAKGELPLGVGAGPIRIDVSDRANIVDLAAITLLNPASGKILWTASGRDGIASLRLSETTEHLSGLHAAKFCRFASPIAPARFFLPAFDAGEFDEPLELEIWLRVHLEIGAVLELLTRNDKSKEVETLRAQCNAVTSERDILQTANRKLQGEIYVSRIDSKREMDKLQDEIAHLREQLANSFNALNEASEKLNRTEREATAPLLKSIADLERKIGESENGRRELEQTVAAIMRSRSWRLTSPLRKLMGGG